MQSTTTAKANATVKQHFHDITFDQLINNASYTYDLLLVKLTRLAPDSTEWQTTYEQVGEARKVLVDYQTRRALVEAKAQEPQPEPTVVEPEPEPELKVKSVAQEKAEANARIALANKGKSAAHKAESLDVPLATVRKVEKAKAAAKVQVPATDKKMDTAAMKKLAKELGVSYEGIKFTSSKARDSFRATLEQAKVKHEAKVWEGLSPSRQAKLSRTASVDPNRANARAIAL